MIGPSGNPFSTVVMLCGQNQDVVPISSYDTAGSFLILGCNNGSIYYIGELHVERCCTGTPGGCPQEAPGALMSTSAGLNETQMS